MKLSDRLAAVAFLAMIGAAQAFVTHRLFTVSPEDGLACAAVCILLWAAFWLCYRLDQAHMPRESFSSPLWRHGGAYLADWDAPEPEDTWNIARRAIRALGARRRARRLVAARLRELSDSDTPVRIELYPDL